MILAATAAERKRMPGQARLSGYWRRCLKGELSVRVMQGGERSEECCTSGKTPGEGRRRR